MRNRRTSVLLAIVLLFLCGFALRPWDVAISRACLKGCVPGEIRAMLHRAEIFGHTYGLLGIAVTIYLLDVGRRRQLWQVIAIPVAAGLTADALKLCLWRVRPRHLLEQLAGQEDVVRTVFAVGWDWQILTDSSLHSLPSAHTAMAVALAVVLTRWYPQAGKWFWTLAVLCGFSRIDGGAHFASDVLWGASLGLLVGYGGLRERTLTWQSRPSLRTAA